MKQTIENKKRISSHKIARRAYEIWESKGQPEGHDLDYWLEAENQIKSEQGAGDKIGRRPGSDNQWRDLEELREKKGQS